MADSAFSEGAPSSALLRDAATPASVTVQPQWVSRPVERVWRLRNLDRYAKFCRMKTTPAPFRLGIVSDLHLEADPHFKLDASELDVLVAVGDILSGDQEVTGVEYLAQAAPDIPVLYVPGNHEFEGHTIEGALDRLRKRAKKTNVRILYRGAVELFGVRFLGATLWSGFDLFGPAQRRRCQDEAQKHLQDFKRILTRSGRPITPQMVRDEHLKDVKWIEKQLQGELPVILLTHFAPAVTSAQREYANDPLTAYWVNPCEKLVKPTMLTAHGHVHASLAYRLQAAPGEQGKVLCNARGFNYTIRLDDVPEESRPLLIEEHPDLAHQPEVRVLENPAFKNPLRVLVDPLTQTVRLED